MLRFVVAFLFWAAFPATVALADEASCWIQDACATGRTLRLLCRESKILTGSEGDVKWREQDLPSQDELRAIRFLDSDRGFVVGQNGTFLATEDGGRNWRQVRLPTREHLTAIHSVAESVWVAGWGGVILYSSDGGRTWSPQPTGVSHGLDSVYFADPMHGWAVGWVGTILRTTDGGKTWQQVRTPAVSWSLNSVYFRDSNHGWAVGFGGQIVRSRDGGVTWEVQSSPVTSPLTSVIFDRSNRGWITTADGLLLSEDGGESWQRLPLDDWFFLDTLLEMGGSLWAVGPSSLLKQDGTSLAWQKIELVPDTLRTNGSPSPTARNRPFEANH